MTDHYQVAGTGWLAGGRLLEALSQRDFESMGSCLAPGIRMRALVPPGPFELQGRETVIACLQRWFGGEDHFELVDASLGTTGPRPDLRWRVRMTAGGMPEVSRLVEQHAFVTAADQIESLDLLCSGFVTEPPAWLRRSPAAAMAESGATS